MSHLVTQLLSSPLLLNETFAAQSAPFFHQLTQQLTQHGPAHANGRSSTDTTAPAKATLTAQLAVRGSSQRIQYLLGDTLALTSDGVAILNLTGPIFRYGFWYYPGTEDYMLMIEQLLASPSIRGLVLIVDSPGGQASGIAGLYDTIALAEKPIIALVSGMAASAAYYAIAGATEIWASQKSDQIGSIGAYITLVDWSGAYAQMGVKIIDIYARVSGQKNAPGREALKGNQAPMQDMLDQLVGFFQQAVRDGRGDKLAAIEGLPAEDNYFEGGVFWAEKAQALGLIDRIGTVAQAIERIYELSAEGYTNPRASGSTNLSTDQTSTTDMALFDKQPLITALAGVAADQISETQLEDINASLSKQGINLKVLSTTQYAEVEKLDAANETLTTENTRLTNEVTRLGKMGTTTPAAPQLAGQEESPKLDGQGDDKNAFLCESDLEAQKMLAIRDGKK